MTSHDEKIKSMWSERNAFQSLTESKSIFILCNTIVLISQHKLLWQIESSSSNCTDRETRAGVT